VRLEPPETVRALQRALYRKAKQEPSYLRRKHQVQSWGYWAFPEAYLYGRLGLYRLPGAPWSPPASASR